MTRRLPTTLTDYVFWLINPMLIMLLLDSFTFYLLEAHYDGEHKLRLLWAFAFFNMGIVACSRISLIEGASAAEFAAIPLMGSMFLVVGWLASSLAAMLLVVVVTFLAFRLAKNTTILDDHDEASTMGLVGRLFAGSTQRQREARARSRPGQRPPATDDPNAAARAAIEEENDGPATPLSRLIDRIRGKRVDETPGLSILYALPLTLASMGISSWFLPEESRTYAHGLLALHLGCALILLATATFLNLRRYLRQRMIQMPERMTGLWVASSAAMLFGVLLAAMILPRPGLFEPLRSELFAGTDWSSPTDWAMSWDGTKGDSDSESSGENGEGDPGDAPQSSGGGDSSGGEPQESQDSQEGDARERQPQNGGGGQPQENGAPAARDDASPAASGGGQSGQPQGEGGSEHSGSSSGSSESSGGKPQDSASQAGGSGDPASTGEPTRSEGSSQEAASPPESPPAEQTPSENPFDRVMREYFEAKTAQDAAVVERAFDLRKFAALIWWAVTFLIWMFVLVGGLYLVYRFRAAIYFMIEEFWRHLREWVQRLLHWGDPVVAGAEGAAAAYVAPPRPFSAYADPFRTGAAASWSLRDLLAYSMEALDAWSRDRQFPRGAGETPGEFAIRLALRDPATRSAVGPFADVYAQAAFAPDGPPGNTIAAVQSLWRFLTMSSGSFPDSPPPGHLASPAPPPPPRQT